MFKPAILIPPPDTDPERKTNRKRKIDSYDPEKPEMEKDRKWTCDVCYKQYLHKGTYKRHLETHYKNFEYYCYECNVAVSRKDSLKPHYKQFHPTIPFPQLIQMREKSQTTDRYKNVKFNIRPKRSEDDPELARLWEKTKADYLKNKKL